MARAGSRSSCSDGGCIFGQRGCGAAGQAASAANVEVTGGAWECSAERCVRNAAGIEKDLEFTMRRAALSLLMGTCVESEP